MSGTKLTVKRNVMALANLQKGIEFIRDMDVLVGVPQETNAPNGDGGITNAELLYIHNNGAPGARIPKRPVLQLGVKEKEEEIRALLNEGITKALNGDISGATAAYEKAGIVGENGVKAVFGSDKLTPNADVTIHGGWLWNKAAKKGFYVKGKGSSAPLIDTGALRKSITHIVRKK